MNKAYRQRVIVHTEPELLGAAVGAWLAERPDLDVVVDSDGAYLRGAGAQDVIVASAPLLSEATVLVMDAGGFSVIQGGTVQMQPYRDLDQLYSVIREKGRPPIRGSTLDRLPKGGGST